jgi:hypothetical protein
MRSGKTLLAIALSRICALIFYRGGISDSQHQSHAHTTDGTDLPVVDGSLLLDRVGGGSASVRVLLCPPHGITRRRFLLSPPALGLSVPRHLRSLCLLHVQKRVSPLQLQSLPQPTRDDRQ